MFDKVDTFVKILVDALLTFLFIFLFLKYTMAMVIIMFVLGFLVSLLLLYLAFCQIEVLIDYHFYGLKEKFNKMLDKFKKS